MNAKHVGDNIYYGPQKDGILSLKKGSQALWNGDYPSAKGKLRVAIEEIDGENQPREAAKANYLFALALLDGQLPRIQGNAVMESIEKLMNNAIRLFPSCAITPSDLLVNSTKNGYLNALNHSMVRPFKDCIWMKKANVRGL